jgi:23S rRNA (guanosine2251-2'-O)-methyltransferase
VMGGEGAGVRPTLADDCDLQLSVPLGRGFDSLNVSVATGILLYEAVRQRST